MFIAGRGNWRISIDEPAACRIALYLRDVEGLAVKTDPSIPPLEPPPRAWPAWARRPEHIAEPLGSTAGIDRIAAAGQWARWWRHLLQVGDAALAEMRPPSFAALSGLPELQALLKHHYATALRWSDAVGDHPLIKRDHLAAGSALTTVVTELEGLYGRPMPPFELRITVIGVQTKHVWELAPDHLLFTHRLIADDQSSSEWLRLRLRVLA